MAQAYKIFFYVGIMYAREIKCKSQCELIINIRSLQALLSVYCAKKEAQRRIVKGRTISKKADYDFIFFDKR
tara:strand:- start:4 stop:219 length:216 start_codon:yes stop_codon:yes gene_type:complete